MPNQEPLKKIGLIIKAAREERGLSQEELAYESRVSVTHLKNIEEANRKELPEEAYLLGFIAKLLKALNFENPNEIIERYKKEEGSYVVQSIVNSYETNDSKLGFAFTDFKIYHLYTIFIICLLVLAWLTITNYGKNNIDLNELKPTIKKINSQFNSQQEATINGAVNGLDLEANQSLLDNVPNATKQVVSNGVGSKLLSIEATNNAWYQIIGVAQQKILYEGDVGPSNAVDRFKFYDDQGFVLATGDAGAFLVDTGNGPFKLGKSNETIKWYYPQTARRIYKTWSETTPATKLDPIPLEAPESALIAGSDVMGLKPFESNGDKKEALVESPTTYNLQEQQLSESPILKKYISPEPANGEVIIPPIKKTPIAQPAYQPRPIITKVDSKKEAKKKKNKKKEQEKREEKERG